jgi:RimJ/RimL family protein N-acetyltransferase
MSIVFDFKKDHILENDTVQLRPLVASDLNNLLKFALTEPEIWKYALFSAEGEDGMKKYIETAIKNKNDEREYPYVVFDKRTNSYAGSTRFCDILLFNSTLQIGYTWYGKEFQGTGLNKNCKYLLLEFAFETLKVERVEFRADNLNARSIAAMKSIGCTVEGVLRNHFIKPDGTRRDSIILSIVKDEWFSHVKQNLSHYLYAK